MKGTGEYNSDWDQTAKALKEKWHWCCERCGHKHSPETGYVLTIHHLDGNKGNDAEWNLACLCQRCHLKIQGHVCLPQLYMFEHSEWMKSHLGGYYKAMAEKHPCYRQSTISFAVTQIAGLYCISDHHSPPTVTDAHNFARKVVALDCIEVKPVLEG